MKNFLTRENVLNGKIYYCGRDDGGLCAVLVVFCLYLPAVEEHITYVVDKFYITLTHKNQYATY